MPKAARILIRKYRKKDREAVRKICWDTAFMGNPAEIFFDDKEILADALVLYYTDYEPESTFVADFNGKIVGYLAGSRDTTRKNEIYTRKILPKLFLSFVRKGLIFREKTAKFLFNAAKSFLKCEFIKAKLSEEYPAHLHINIEKDFRRFGIGKKLVTAFFAYLRKNNIHGIALSTFSEHGRNFFIKHKFIQLNERKFSQWRYLTGRNMTSSTFGIKI